MGTDDGEKEVGYGVDTRVNRVATFVDGIIYTAAKGQLKGAEEFLEEIEPISGLKKKILLARAAYDLDDVRGKILIQVLEGDGEQFVTADVFSFSSGVDSPLPTKTVAGIMIDANSQLFVDSPEGPNVTPGVLKLIIDGVAATQARIEKEGEGFMTRNDLQRLMG